MPKPLVRVHGMHGLGDNLHQRAILRELMKQFDVVLESSWVAPYHDLIAQGLRVVRKPVALRTQLKNAAREAAKFAAPTGHSHHSAIRISYSPGHTKLTKSGTVLEAMFQVAGLQAAFTDYDYRLPVPSAWCDDPSIVRIKEAAGDKPILVYRPLTARPEWRGGQVRNANGDDYAEIFASIRDDFFVVSVADLEPGREWLVGPRLKADMEFHKGELVFEALAALFSRAVLVYTSGGFGVVLGPAVGTPVISVHGGYERASWVSTGSKFIPYLGIEPINPCECSTSACMNTCLKKINVPSAIARVREFVSERCGVVLTPQSRGRDAMFDPQADVQYIAAATPRRFPHNPNPLIQQLAMMQAQRQSIKA